MRHRRDQQGIIGTNAGLVNWRIYASLGTDEVMDERVLRMLWFFIVLSLSVTESVSCITARDATKIFSIGFYIYTSTGTDYGRLQKHDWYLNIHSVEE